MIENIIKILDKIKDSIEKYAVYCDIWGNVYHISYKVDDATYCVDITGTCIKIYNCNQIKDKSVGTTLDLKYADEISKYEVLKLAEIIRRNCEDYTFTQIRNFADSFDDNEID